MNIKNLIEKLQKFDLEKMVVIAGYEGGYSVHRDGRHETRHSG